MASPILLQAQPGKTGVTVDILPVNSDTPIITGFGVSENVPNSGYYEGNYLGSDVGLHRVIIKQGIRTLGNWYLDLKNSGTLDKCGDINPDIDDIKTNSFVGGTDSLPSIAATLNNALNHLKALVFDARQSIDTVVTQVQFTSTLLVPVETDSIIGSHVVIYKGDDLGEMNIRKITAYDGLGTYTIETAPGFTLTTADTFSLVLSKFERDINMGQSLPGVPLNLTTGGALANADNLAFTGGTSFVHSSVESVQSDSDLAQKFFDSLGSIETGSAVGGVATVTQMDTDLPSFVDDDHYVGRILIFTSGLLDKQATNITAYDASLQLLTYSTITQAPQAGNTFLIL